jgi:curved DNA-binding protein CbpA
MQRLLQLMEIIALPPTERELTKIFRKLSLKYHPDKSDDPNATAVFQEISNAYQTLFEILKKKTTNLGKQLYYNFHTSSFVKLIILFCILILYQYYIEIKKNIFIIVYDP